MCGPSPWPRRLGGTGQGGSGPNLHQRGGRVAYDLYPGSYPRSSFETRGKRPGSVTRDKPLVTGYRGRGLLYARALLLVQAVIVTSRNRTSEGTIGPCRRTRRRSATEEASEVRAG